MSAFDLLNPQIQKVVFDMKWGSFRPIQEEAITHLLQNPSDMIISAPTASGKTEAALLPIISQIAESGREHVKILYVSPLKALINDQFTRVEKLCRYIDFPITKWHGDANASRKEKLLKNPAGILLITPESMEALLLNKKEYVADLFKYIDYIVIDEVHSFIGNERGTQLKSLIRRIEKMLHIHPLKIALSATISNMQDIAGWLNPEQPETVKIIEDKSRVKETVGIIKCYVQSNQGVVEEAEIKARATGQSEVQQPDETLKADLFKATQTGKTLIFANSKAVLEEYCAALQEMARAQNFPNHYYIHHGSLAKNIREDTERALKTESNIAVFCTNTLELGIDIGNIDRVLFLDAPVSVASMVQKLGRSGRKAGTRREFRFFLPESGKGMNSGAFNWNDMFRADLVQSIAIVELMLAGFSEPLDTVHFDYSTFLHQILSYLGQTGGADASSIYKTIAVNSFNGAFSKVDFIDILKYLNKEKIVYQLPDKTITLHLKGEQLVENYGFYAAFATPEMWKVMYNGREIGEIGADSLSFLEVGSRLLLAGRGWEVVELKRNVKIMLVKPTVGQERLKFSGGMQNIHQAVHHQMRQIYENHFIPAYLSKKSVPVLEEAFKNYDLFAQSENGALLAVLEGTKVQKTLQLLFHYFQKSVESCAIGFVATEEGGRAELIDFLKGLDLKTLDFEPILNTMKRDLKCFHKFDYLLPDNILNKSYMQTHLDIAGTIAFVERLK